MTDTRDAPHTNGNGNSHPNDSHAPDRRDLPPAHYTSEARMYTPPPDRSPRRASPAQRREERDDPAARKDRQPDMYASRREFHRRGSPEYGGYAPPNGGGEQEGGWRRPPPIGGGGGGDWLESRRRQREASAVTIWPPSPRSPERELTPERRRKRRRTPESGSEEEEERHKRKHRSERHRHRSSRRKRREESEESEDSEEEERRKRRKERERLGEREEREKEKERKRERSKSLRAEEEGMWVEKADDAPAAPTPAAPAVAAPRAPARAQSDDEEVGPQPAPLHNDALSERDYGSALLRGEGSAMAAYVQSNERIPRRGEIGLNSVEIDTYEQAGYVMSGSRHKRMNAVRMRKENQVISAEEKRSLLKLQREEREKREGEIVGGFKEMLEERLKGALGPALPPKQ
ncbi:DUF926-domain-containing protein [Calocera viscosa TUFC12733]|uniref:DUF926-domain-containing protein n=1 Tax=Calocera viscosa (strain TUFC12733) TaxID=1330018 RepID=A0A167S8B5_CALVF|nr:DUF926-domain-containing protein [Calocera viscosa TUFC12733]